MYRFLLQIYSLFRQETKPGSTRLLSLFEKYSAKDGCDRERVSAIIGSMLINAGLVEVPSSLEPVFEEIMSKEKEYREWMLRIPKEKFVN